MKNRPPGKPTLMPMSGVNYHVPMSKQSHIIGHDMIHDEDPTFLCGRSVHAPQPWYDKSPAHDKWGDWYIIYDKNVTGHCGACKTKWAAEEAKRTYDKGLQAEARNMESPISQAEWEEHQGKVWKQSDTQFNLTCDWVRDLLGGTYVESESTGHGARDSHS